MYYVYFDVFLLIPGSPGFPKSGSSGQMTMPARRAPKFSAKRRALLHLIIFQSLISYVIPGHLEPWPECQLELI